MPAIISSPHSEDPDDVQPPLPAPAASAPASPVAMNASPSGNPLVDEIDSHIKAMSPGAQAVVSRLSAAGAMPMTNGSAGTPPPAAPAITPLRASSPAPTMGATPSAATPAVTPMTALPPLSARIQADTDELHRKQQTGSGISQIHNPWLRIPLQIAEAVGGSFFPKIDALLPGTELHHQVLVGQDQEKLANDQGVEAHQAALAKDAADLARSQAETDLTKAQTSNLTDPIAQAQRQIGLAKTQAEVNDMVANAKKADAETDRILNGAADNQWQQWQQQHGGKNADPIEFERQKEAAKLQPISAQDAADLNAAWDLVAKKSGIPPGLFHAGMSSKAAEDLRTSLNAAVTRQQGAVNLTIKQEGVDNSVKKTREAGLKKAFDTASTGIMKSFDALEKQRESIEEAKQLISGNAPAQAVGQIKTLSSLASGQGSGVRITQTELNALAHARGLGDSFEAWLNSLEGKGNLAKDQVKNIQGMLDAVAAKILEKQQSRVEIFDKLRDAETPEQVHQIQSDFMKQQIGNSASVPTITNKDQFDALPKGAHYMNKGVEYIK